MFPEHPGRNGPVGEGKKGKDTPFLPPVPPLDAGPCPWAARSAGRSPRAKGVPPFRHLDAEGRAAAGRSTPPAWSGPALRLAQA